MLHLCTSTYTRVIPFIRCQNYFGGIKDNQLYWLGTSFVFREFRTTIQTIIIQEFCLITMHIIVRLFVRVYSIHDKIYSCFFRARSHFDM